MVTTDLDHLFSLEAVTDWMFEHPEIFEKWLKLSEQLQYLIAQKRRMGLHIELESNSWQVSLIQ